MDNNTALQPGLDMWRTVQTSRINGSVIVGEVTTEGPTMYRVTVDDAEMYMGPHKDSAIDYLRNAVDWAHMRGVA